MLKNYLIVAFRALRRRPVLSAANIAGLAVGLAACILILFYLFDELTFDSMHRDGDRIVRVIEEREASDGAKRHYAYTSGALGPELRTSLTDVENSARLIGSWGTGRRVVERGEARFYVGDHAFAEPAFFEMFDFPFVAGNASGALDEPNEVVLTTAAAERYFGREDPVGQTIAVEGLGDLTVTGVVDLPNNTHVDYSIFFSLATLLQNDDWRAYLASWESSIVVTYLLLSSRADLSRVDAEVSKTLSRHADPEVGSRRMPYLQPLSAIHLSSSHVDFDVNRAKGSPAYMYLFGAVALFILLIAIINYTNMATAQSLRRTREIGMRKTVGAHRRQLAAQFLVESILTTFIALLLAGVLVRLSLPLFSAMSGKTLSIVAAGAGAILTGSVLLAVLVGVAAGSYPALYLSRFRPTASLQAAQGSERLFGAPIRKGLVILQFTLSIALLIGTITLHRQLDFVQNTRLGFNEDELVIVDINDYRVRSGFESVKAEFAGIPGVEHVSVSNRIPGDWKTIPRVDIARAGIDQVSTAHFLGVDEDFLETFEIDLIDGASFGRGFATDSTSVLVNETAARQFGLSPHDVLRFPEVGACTDCPLRFEARVAGIVGDFHYESLHLPIGPLVIGYRANPIDVIDYFSIRADGRRVPEVLEGLRRVGERYDPDHPFEYNFLDARLAGFYEGERQVRSVLGAAAFLALLIACMGLFGLAALTAERRTKEIGIRKALGATVGQIVGLLTGDFARLVGIAFAIASPLAYFGITWWLQGFAYRAPVAVTTFLVAGGGALIVALLTVSYQSIRAALADPVASLRYE